MGESVILERDGAVAMLTLNRPDKLNSFTTEMTSRLAEAFLAIERDASCRVVLITGAGRGFCSGQDLSERAAHDASAPPVDVGHSIDTRFNPLIRRMRALPKPIVIAVNGVAAGAGANFALAGDLTLAAKSARFIQSFVKIGLMPDCGGTWLLPHLVGAQRAMALAMLADPLTAEQAAEWGLIWQAVEDSELMPRAHELARKLAAQSAPALAAIKSAIHAASTRSFDAALDNERDSQRTLGYGADFREGVTAFLEKRPAKFG